MHCYVSFAMSWLTQVISARWRPGGCSRWADSSQKASSATLSLWLMCGNTWSPCRWLYGVLLNVVRFYMSLVFRGAHVAGEMTTTIESWHKTLIASTVTRAIAVVPRSQTSLSQDLSKPLKFILILHKPQFKCWGCHMLKWAFCYRLFFLLTFKCTVATLHHYSVSMRRHLLDSFLGRWFSNEGHRQFGTVFWQPE